jgi:anti-sigma factor RsiW
VTDWAGAGYALVGARLDRLEGQPVAALVYRHRNHVIDVFVRPALPGAAAPPTHTVRGFNVATAVGADMQWVAASDLNNADLAEFAKGLAKGSVTAAGD